MPDPARGAGANVQDTVSLSALYARLEEAGHAVDRPEALVDGSGGKDAIIGGWLDDAAEALVQPLIAVNCLINPPAILIGGRLPGRLAEELVEPLNARMAERPLPVVALVDRMSVVSGQTVSVRFTPGGRRIIK